jgi:hypothetical protein
MLIKLTDFFRGKKPGDVIDWNDLGAQILIDQKRAVKVEEAKEKTIDAPPVDKSMQRRVIKKKG